MELGGRSAIVTGAGSGIGEAIARRLAGEGAAVTVVDVDEDQGRGTAEAIVAAGGQAMFVRTDVADPDAVAQMVDHAESGHGPLEVLVNNAGVVTGLGGRFPDCEPAAWMRVVDVNLRGQMLGTHLGIRAMRGHGRGGAIVNVASLAGIGLGPHPSPDYAATKAGVIRFTAALVALGEEGIRVNCVCPDWVDTPMSRRTREAMTPEVRAAVVPSELLTPADIADAVLELVVDDSLAGRVMGCYCGHPSYRRLLPADDSW